MFEKRKEKKNAKWTATTIIVTGAFICMSSSSSGPSDNFVAAAVAVVAVCKNWFSKFTLLLCPKYSLFFFVEANIRAFAQLWAFFLGLELKHLNEFASLAHTHKHIRLVCQKKQFFFLYWHTHSTIIKVRKSIRKHFQNMKWTETLFLHSFSKDWNELDFPFFFSFPISMLFFSFSLLFVWFYRAAKEENKNDRLIRKIEAQTKKKNWNVILYVIFCNWMQRQVSLGAHQNRTHCAQNVQTKILTLHISKVMREKKNNDSNETNCNH